MAQGLLNFDAALKEDYHGPITEQLNNENLWAAQLDTDTENFQGRRFVAPLHTGRNSGVGARAENATLPTAGNQAFKDIFGPIRLNYCRIQLSTLVIESSQKDKGSFVRAMDAEMNGAVKDTARDECRQSWGESNGRLATCGTTTAATTVVLAAATTTNQLRWISDRGVIDIGTLANPTSVASARTVTSVNTAAKTIVISGAAVTTSSSNFIFASGSGGASSNSGQPGDGQVELTGIQTMVDDTAVLHTIDPASNAFWKSQKYASVGSITETALVKAMNDTEIASGMSPDLLIGSYGVQRAIASLFYSLKRFNDGVTLKGGFKALSLDTIVGGGRGSSSTALVAWRDCPDNTLYGFSTKSFKQYLLKDWDWLSDDGAVLSRVGNTAAYEATLEKMSEYVCTQRNANFVMQGITATE